jgi:hypothetical protein
MVEAEIRSGLAESSMRPLWHSIAAFAAILPAIGAALAVRGVIKAFERMAETGSGGVGTAAIGMYEANRPLIIAAAVAAALAGWLAATVLRKPRAFPGLLLSLTPVLGCIPALLLWMVESLILKVIAPDAAGSVADVSQRIGNLLTASFMGAMIVIAIVIAIFAVSLARPRSTDSALPPVAVWGALSVLLIGLAAAFYMRSSYLYQVALTGQL